MQAVVVTGLFYGDEGKGTITAFLAENLPDVRVVVRHSGGCQASHNVVASDGRHHNFSQFGSGSFTPGVRTHLSRLMMVNPLNLYPEAEHLIKLGVTDIWERLTVDRDCLVTTPFHALANILREGKRKEKHGTCGLGIGETRLYENSSGGNSLHIKDLFRRVDIRFKLNCLNDFYAEEFGRDWPKYNEIRRSINDLVDAYYEFSLKVRIIDSPVLKTLIGDGNVIFEGAQGVLLDEVHGFQPHTTWSKTTSENARQILRNDLDQDPYHAHYIGVTRTYSTRHGVGPFYTGEAEIEGLEELHNDSYGTQGTFRVGYWDAQIANYITDIDQPTTLAVTHCDKIKDRWGYCKSYLGDQSCFYEIVPGEECLDIISSTLSAPVLIESHGMRTDQKKISEENVWKHLTQSGSGNLNSSEMATR